MRHGFLIKVPNHANTNMPPKTTEKTAEKPAAADPKAAEAAKASAARQRDLDAAISSITKAYGDGSIMRLGDARALRQSMSSPRARWRWTWRWA